MSDFDLPEDSSQYFPDDAEDPSSKGYLGFLDEDIEVGADVAFEDPKLETVIAVVEAQHLLLSCVLREIYEDREDLEEMLRVAYHFAIARQVGVEPANIMTENMEEHGDHYETMKAIMDRVSDIKSDE